MATRGDEVIEEDDEGGGHTDSMKAAVLMWQRGVMRWRKGMMRVVDTQIA